METEEVIAAVIFGLISILLLTYAFFTSKEKGPILSNTWIFATKSERRFIDKSGEYHMVTVVFGMLGIIILLLALEILTAWTWIFSIMGVLIIILIAYAIIESIKTEKRK